MFKTYPGPHRAEDVPKNCWTCKHRTMVLSGITTCKRIPNETHIKIGIEPCQEFELNTVWMEVDWGYCRS